MSLPYGGVSTLSQCPEFDYGCGFLCLFTFSEKFVNALPDAYAALIPIMQGEL